MATATAAAWVRLAGAGYVLDYGAWFTADGRAIAMSVAADDVVLEAPPRPEFAALLAAEVLGSSGLRAVELETTVSRPAALILAAALDDARRDAQLAARDGATDHGTGRLGDRRARARRRRDPRDDGVTGLVVGALGAPTATPTADEALAALDELVGVGVFAREGDRVVPAGALRALAARCSSPSARLELRRAWTTASTTIETAGLHALQFGVHDVLVVEPVGATVRIATEAAANLVELIGAFLANAPALT